MEDSKREETRKRKQREDEGDAVESIPSTSTGDSTIKIGSFNTRGAAGRYTFESLINFCNDYHLAVLCLQEASSSFQHVDSRQIDKYGQEWILSHYCIKASKRTSNVEYMVIIYNSTQVVVNNIEKVTYQNVIRPALKLNVRAKTSSRNYSIVTAHLTYGTGRDAVASGELTSLMTQVAQNGVHIIIGDLNVHGDRIGSSRRQTAKYAICPIGANLSNDNSTDIRESRYPTRNKQQLLPTSSAGHPLDRALYLRSAEHFAGRIPTVNSADPNQAKFFENNGTDKKRRTAAIQADNKTLKKSDHSAIYVNLPITPPQSFPDALPSSPPETPRRRPTMSPRSLQTTSALPSSLSPVRNSYLPLSVITTQDSSTITSQTCPKCGKTPCEEECELD